MMVEGVYKQGEIGLMDRVSFRWKEKKRKAQT